MTLRSNTRKQFDYSRPLIKEDSHESFLRLDGGGDAADTAFPEGGKVGNLRRKETVPEPIKKPEASAVPTDPQKGKPNIAIPSVNKVEDQSKEAENARKFQAEENYIRYSYVKLYPQPEIYEATDYDLEFLKELNLNSSGKLKTGSEQITREDFERMIEIWDAETDKDEPISFQKAQAAIEKVFDVNAFKDQISEIYIYWKGRREAFKRPLVRKYWRTVNRDESNPNVVFRAREKQKIETRRHKRGNTIENLDKMKGLKHELEMAKTLLANLCLREMMKYELNGLSIAKFDMAVQEKIEGAGSSINFNHYKEKFDNEDRLLKRNQFKEFNKIAQQYINQPSKDEIDNAAGTKAQALANVGTKNINRIEESNFLLARFIANVVLKAEQKHITPEKVEKLDLPSVQQPVQLPQPTPIIEQIVPPIIVKNPSSQEKPRESRNSKGALKPISVSKQPSKPTEPPLTAVPEEKNIFRYKIRRRIGRQGKICIDKVYIPPDEYQFEQLRDRTNEIVPPRKIVKLDTFERGPLNALYENKYRKIEDVYPFADSDDDKDLAEFSRTMKKSLSSFKTFQKQRRSSILATE